MSLETALANRLKKIRNFLLNKDINNPPGTKGLPDFDIKNLASVIGDDKKLVDEFKRWLGVDKPDYGKLIFFLDELKTILEKIDKNVLDQERNLHQQLLNACSSKLGALNEKVNNHPKKRIINRVLSNRKSTFAEQRRRALAARKSTTQEVGEINRSKSRAKKKKIDTVEVGKKVSGTRLRRSLLDSKQEKGKKKTKRITATTTKEGGSEEGKIVSNKQGEISLLTKVGMFGNLGKMNSGDLRNALHMLPPLKNLIFEYENLIIKGLCVKTKDYMEFVESLKAVAQLLENTKQEAIDKNLITVDKEVTSRAVSSDKKNVRKRPVYRGRKKIIKKPQGNPNRGLKNGGQGKRPPALTRVRVVKKPTNDPVTRSGTKKRVGKIVPRK